VLESATRKKATVEILHSEKIEQRSSGRVILVVSLAKGQRFDWLISKCSELGVDHIIPAIYKRTVKQGSGNKLSQRYKKLAISAAKQCKRVFLPIIDSPQKFEVALEELKKLYPNAVLITASLSDSARSLYGNVEIPAESDKIIFIGPEGGLTEQEEAFLEQNGAVKVRLSDTVLRVETAAIAVSSVLVLQRDAVK
jgi:16S rRNA (uracil1498-N3)-methyltransferase